MRKYEESRKLNIYLIIASLVALLIITSFIFGYNAIHIFAAAGEKVNFNETDVLDDLLHSTVNGEAFDIRDYPPDTSKKCEVINFVEYCYSYDKERQSDYALYIYVYNPAVLDIKGDSNQNKISIAISYNAEHEPNDYQKFNLAFCSKSEGAYDRLFYKFRIDDPNKIILNNVNSNERRYDVAEIELLTNGNSNATAYTVGGSYRFTGYAKGFGIDPKAESTLDSTVFEFETITLEVKDTYYRLAKNASEAEQITSVYFSVDNSILERYGRLQKIKAEWYEYKTKEIVVTSNQAVYNALLPYVGVDIDGYNSNIGYKLAFELDLGGTIMRSWGYNHNNSAAKNCNRLSYVFFTNGTDIDNYILPGEVLKQYIYDYNKSAVNGYLPIKYGRISADLFENDVDSDRTKGYNLVNIDAGDLFDLFGFDNTDFWGWWIDQFYDIPSINLEDVTPIYDVKSSDLLGTDKEISDRLLIAENDSTKFKEYCNQSFNANQTPFLFRFAVSDYVSYPLTVREDNTFNTPHSKWAHYAQETVFLDFDIIQLTFNKDGVYHVIPVVQSPLDIVSDITPPYSNYDGINWLMLLFIGAVLFLGIIIIVKAAERIF